MTAEIAILNKSAVALAADSAVSIGDNAEKIYATNKLFALSKCHPCGIMIYGNALFMGVPFETIVKLHREDLSANDRPTIEEYAGGFMACLKETRFAIVDAEKAHAQAVFEESFSQLSRSIQEQMYELMQTKGRFSTRDVAHSTDVVFSKQLADLQATPDADSLGGLKPNAVTLRYRDQFEAAKDACCKELGLTQSSVKKLRQIATLSLIKDRFSGLRSGIVVAGFGSREMFPSLTEFEVDGMVAGKLKFRKVRVRIVTPTNAGIIVPFAHRRMVSRFMEGIDPEYSQYISYAFLEMLTRLSDEIIDTVVTGTPVQKEALKVDWKSKMPTRVDELSKQAEAYRRNTFVRPILDTVRILPKHELANMAEALVSLQSLKLRVTMEKEVVGGPIDVALISKGDGFIWIKRKHYFDPALNQHFFRHYFRG